MPKTRPSARLQRTPSSGGGTSQGCGCSQQLSSSPMKTRGTRSATSHTVTRAHLAALRGRRSGATADPRPGVTGHRRTAFQGRGVAQTATHTSGRQQLVVPGSRLGRGHRGRPLLRVKQRRCRIIPRHQENVSIELATEYVAVCASLMPEKAWWALCRVDERTNLDARRDARRASRVARCAKWASSFRARG